MERIVLFCDNHPLKHAVQRLALSNGRGTKKGLQLDACAACARQAYKLFKPRNAPHPATPPPEGAGKGRTGRSKSGGLHEAGRQRAARYDYELLGAKFMKYAPKEPFQASALRKHFKLPKGVVFRIANHLIKAGKLKSDGAGSSRRLTKVV